MLSAYIINVVCLYLGLNLSVIFPITAVSNANPTRKSFIETQVIVTLLSAAIAGLAM